MKKIITLAIVLIYHCSFAQTTTVGFKKGPKQEYTLGQKLSIEVTVENEQNYESDKPISLLVESPEDILITNPPKLEFNPKHGELTKNIGYYIDLEKLKGKTHFTLSLKKHQTNDSYHIAQKDLFVVIKKEATSEFSLALEKLDDQSMNIGLDDDYVFRFQIISKGYRIKKSDKLKLSFQINDSSIKTELEVDEIQQDKTVHTIHIEKSKDNYDKIRKLFKENNKVSLSIASVTHNGNTNIKHSISENSNKLVFNSNNPKLLGNRYDIFLGSNFDIQEEFSTSKFFAEINVFLPNVFNNYGLRGGVYKNNTSTSLEENRRRDTIVSQIQSPMDSITYQRKLVNSTPKVEIENLGLYVEGLYSLKKTDNFNMFIGFHVEVIQRVETYTFENTDLIVLEQETIPLTALPSNPNLVNELTRPTSYTNKYVDSYFGFSLPTFYHHTGTNGKNLEVMINPSLGIGEPGVPLRPRDGNSLSLYGFTQFHLIFGSEKGLKFKIGGEARKYFNFDQAPIITVNLSAAVNLEELFKTSGG